MKFLQQVSEYFQTNKKNFAQPLGHILRRKINKTVFIYSEFNIMVLFYYLLEHINILQ